MPVPTAWPLTRILASGGSITNRTSPNSGDNVTLRSAVSPRASASLRLDVRKPALDTLTVCVASGLSGTINGVKPANAPSTVTPAPDGVLFIDNVASAGVSEMAPKLWSMPATIWSGTVTGIKPGALSVSSCSPDRTSIPLSVISVVSPSRVAMTSLGVAVKVTYAQSGTSAICTVWLWLRPATSMALSQGWKRVNAAPTA